MAKQNPQRTMVKTFRALNPGHRFFARVVPPKSVPSGKVLRGSKALTVEAPTAELYLCDVIGSDFFGGGISAQEVTDALQQFQAQGVKELFIYMNSPGGDVFEATAIYNALDRFRGSVQGKITVQNDALAASAASYVAMVGDDIITAPNAMWMIHNPWGLAIGDSTDMRATADVLDKVGSTLLGVYAERSGMDPKDVQALMDAETWMTADEALEYGFTDQVAKPSEVLPNTAPAAPPPAAPAAQPPGPSLEQASAPPTSTGASLLVKYKNTPEGLKPKAKDLIDTMEKRIMDRKRTSPPAAPGPASVKKA
jgi:ATP-dependent Clp endopeptidase proteolytic subunit ClpP